MSTERTIEERVEDISLRYGYEWDRGVEAYIEGEFRLALAQGTRPLRDDLEELSTAAVEIRLALLSPTLDVERLCRAKTVLGEALARPGIVELLRVLEERRS